MLKVQTSHSQCDSMVECQLTYHEVTGLNPSEGTGTCPSYNSQWAVCRETLTNQENIEDTFGWLCRKSDKCEHGIKQIRNRGILDLTYPIFQVETVSFMPHI